jgi:hypothetical protein
LQWERANGCQWSERAYEEAAYDGNFEVLQWLHEHGCP